MRAQLLDAERPTGLLELVRHLGMLQLDPIAAVAPSADLVAWSRLGSAYFPAELRERLGERARERSRAFTEEAVLPQLARLYEETAGMRAGTTPASANMTA